jgi:uncharacterized membrane protein
VSRERLEAFSDGVFAVAITLLVLDLTVPAPGDSHGHHLSLAHELVTPDRWSHYLAFVVSFLTIGIIWINHHAMIRRLRAVDHAIMFLNLTLLMFVVTIPFTTNLMATYLRAGYGSHLATGIYAGSFLLMSVAFAALNRHILFPKAHLLLDRLDESERRLIFSRVVAGLLPYLIATAVATLSAIASLAICAAVAAFYALPVASGTNREQAPG